MNKQVGHCLRLIALALLGEVGRLRTFNRGLVFCFHSVRQRPTRAFYPTADVAIQPCFLDAFLRLLRRSKIDIIPLDEVLARVRSRNWKPFVAFTFDDGYRDNFDVAFPIFLRHGAPFAVFLATGFLDRSHPMWWVALEAAVRHAESIILPSGETVPTNTLRQKHTAFAAASKWFRQAAPSPIGEAVHRLLKQSPGSVQEFETEGAALSWDMVREMRDSGLVHFGCHTLSHPSLSRLDDAMLKREIVEARDRITEETGTIPAFFAYPYGTIGDIGSAEAVVAACGFAAAFTTNGRPIAPGDADTAFMLPRVSWSGAHQRPNNFYAHASGVPLWLESQARRGFTYLQGKR